MIQIENKDIQSKINNIENLINQIDNLIKPKNIGSDLTKQEYDKITVACIMDEFSYNCFKDEGKFIYLTPKNWKNVIENEEIDFLLVESVWTGLNDSWKYKFINLQEDSEFKRNSNKQINEILDYFKDKFIPTVFWNKEDPIHYDEFIYLAKKFDYVFTTDSNIITKYKEDCKHNNIYAMQFAANLKIHNPIGKDLEKKGNIAFAGSWYERHEDRKIVTREILDMFKDEDLTIYDRHFNNETNGRNVFPEEYRQFIKGSLPYNEMIKAYKHYNIFLNVNTVLNSPTMYSRRVFELLACGTNIVTTKSLGIKKDFNDLVVFTGESNSQNNINKILKDKEYRDKNSVKCIREIIKKHTYEHRFDYLIETLGINNKKEKNDGVTVISPTNRSEFLDNIISNYTAQTYINKELIIIINKNSIDIKLVREKLKNINNAYVYKLDEDKTLGECINYAVRKSTYNYIAKFDDDDFYGGNYLEDSLNVFKFTDAGVVGKKSMYIYYEESKKLEIKYPNVENKYTDFVAGATLVFKKDVFNKVQLEARNQGEDTSFLNNCKAMGIKIYSSDRFNYIALRRADKSTHTWQVNDDVLQRKSEVVNIKVSKFDDAKKYVSV